jgi:hypothetical protein
MSDEGLIYFSIPLKYSLADYMSYYEKVMKKKLSIQFSYCLDTFTGE